MWLLSLVVPVTSDSSVFRLEQVSRQSVYIYIFFKIDGPNGPRSFRSGEGDSSGHLAPSQVKCFSGQHLDIYGRWNLVE